MSDIDQLVTRYLNTWNDTDSAHRRAEIDAIWEPDGRYVDPVNDATGPDRIDAMIGAFQSQFPGVTFRLLGPIDSDADEARFRWAFGPDGGDPIATGSDVVVPTGAGRLASVCGYFDAAIQKSRDPEDRIMQMTA